MNELIEQLKEWKDNINSDIKSDWIEDDKKSESNLQSLALSMAIGILANLGENNNIPK